MISANSKPLTIKDFSLAGMLACGWIRPRDEAWQFTRNEKVDMTPWRFAKPLAITLFSCVVATYLLFSPLGVASAGGFSPWFAPLLGALAIGNAIVWVLASRKPAAA